MTYLLIVYDLDAGRARRMETFDEPRPALEGRFAAEKVEPGRCEIIVLSGEIKDMKRTHGKYFKPGWETLLRRSLASESN